MRIRYGVLALIGALGACDSNKTIPCAQSLSAYCSTAPCVTKIDPNDIVNSFCASSSAPKDGFGVTDCPDGGALAVDFTGSTTGVDYVYGRDGTLQAVLNLQGAEGNTCVAGPAAYEPSPGCKSNLIGYQCVGDAGPD